MKVADIENGIREMSFTGEDRIGERYPNAKYIFINEVRDKHAEGKPVFLIPQLVKLHDAVRETSGRPTTITSGYRTRESQDALISNYGKAVFSPHTCGTAIDIDTYTMKHAEEYQKAFYEAADRLGYPKPRIGIHKYLGNFIHVDLAFFLFTEFGGEYDYPEDSAPICRAWRPGATW